MERLMPDRAIREWGTLWFDSVALALEAGAVINLRLFHLASGDQAALREARLMVAEKVAAAVELQHLALTGRLGTTPQRQAAGTIARLRRKVASNRRRLARKPD